MAEASQKKGGFSFAWIAKFVLILLALIIALTAEAWAATTFRGDTPDATEKAYEQSKNGTGINSASQINRESTDKVCQQLFAEMEKFVGSSIYGWVGQASAKWGVPQQILVAQLEAESSFNPNASSGVAYGIAQFTPDTASSFGIDPANPSQAINAQAQYMASLYKGLGSWDLALAGYNAGGGAVSDFKNGTNTTGKNPNHIKTIDGIPPYAETMNYVKKIDARVQQLGSCFTAAQTTNATPSLLPVAGNNPIYNKAIAHQADLTQFKQSSGGCLTSSDNAFLFLAAPDHASDVLAIQHSNPGINACTISQTGNRLALWQKPWVDGQGFTDRPSPDLTADQNKSLVTNTLGQLQRGDGVIWHVNGNASGGHWILMLNITAPENNDVSSIKVSYFDPADGLIHADEPITQAGGANGKKYFSYPTGSSDIGLRGTLWRCTNVDQCKQ